MVTNDGHATGVCVCATEAGDAIYMPIQTVYHQHWSLKLTLWLISSLIIHT